LKTLVAAGRRIGDIAHLQTAALETLIRESAIALPETRARAEPTMPSRAVRALERFDADALGEYLGDALSGLGGARFVREVAAPLLVEVGDRWADGRGSVAEERLLSGTLRNLLGGMISTRGRGRGPRVILAAPRGERHDLGVVMAALLAIDFGFSIYYLGGDLPAAEIGMAARRARASVVALGVVYRGNRARAVAEIRAILRALPTSTELWLGGADATAVLRALRSKQAVHLADFDTLEAELRRLRGGRNERADAER
jgi:methylmalonyl-CoA mutase cobalamin-binding subunit